jgi:flagellar M-ring protein FliF
MNSTLDKIRRLLTNTNPVQRIAIGAALVAVIAGALLLVTSGGGSGRLSPLYTDLSQGDAASIVSELESLGVSYELKDSGATIMVPTDSVNRTRLSMSEKGLPESNDGYALLDKQGITASEFRQRTAYQRALEGELENTIEELDAIDGAVVHLALPAQSAFVDEGGNPTASVLVRTRSKLSEGQVQSIVYLVSSSVRDMKPEDVTLADSDGVILHAPGAGGFAMASGGGKEADFEASLGASINQLVARVAGQGKVAVQVQVVLNMDERTSVSETYTKPEGSGEANTGLVGTENANDETYNGINSTSSNVLGPDGVLVSPNVTTPITAPATTVVGAPTTTVVGAPATTVVARTVTGPGSSTDYTKNDFTRDYKYNKVVEEVKDAPGAIERLSVAVAVDDVAVTAEVVTQIEQLVRAAAGIDDARGDTVVVTRMPFAKSGDELQTQIDENAKAESQARLFTLIRAILLALALAAMAFFAYRSVRKSRTVIVESIDISGLNLSSDTNPTNVTSVVVEGSTDEGAYANEAEAQLARMSEMQPDAVAQVLRTWLSEPRR